MPKNIWIAAGDGDLDRVQFLVEQHALSPNLPDPFTYTPMHAAASYGHLHVLDYLLSRGGDVNVTDEDGDTPLYTVESVPVARFLIDRGANIHHRNNDDLSPADHLAEDFPAVASFLRSLDPSSPTDPSAPAPAEPSQHAQHITSEQLTADLLESTQDILRRAATEGREPDDDELRRAVTRTVLNTVVAGYQLSTAIGTSSDTDTNTDIDCNTQPRPHTNGTNGVSAKRPRTDDSTH